MNTQTIDLPAQHGAGQIVLVYHPTRGILRYERWIIDRYLAGQLTDDFLAQPLREAT